MEAVNSNQNETSEQSPVEYGNTKQFYRGRGRGGYNKRVFLYLIQIQNKPYGNKNYYNNENENYQYIFKF